MMSRGEKSEPGRRISYRLKPLACWVGQDHRVGCAETYQSVPTLPSIFTRYGVLILTGFSFYMGCMALRVLEYHTISGATFSFFIISLYLYVFSLPSTRGELFKLSITFDNVSCVVCVYSYGRFLLFFSIEIRNERVRACDA